MGLLKQDATLFATGTCEKILCCYRSSFLDDLGKNTAFSNINSLEFIPFKSHMIRNLSKTSVSHGLMNVFSKLTWNRHRVLCTPIQHLPFCTTKSKH